MDETATMPISTDISIGEEILRNHGIMIVYIDPRLFLGQIMVEEVCYENHSIIAISVSGFELAVFEVEDGEILNVPDEYEDPMIMIGKVQDDGTCIPVGMRPIVAYG